MSCLGGTVRDGDDDILFTSEGTPIEMLMFRSTTDVPHITGMSSARFDALERLAIFHRHFTTTQVGICITDPEAGIIEVNELLP